MRRVITFFVFGFSLGFAGTSRAYDDESPDAYEIVATASVSVLPDALRPFFEENLDAVKRVATSVPAVPEASASHTDNGESHYVILDVAATGSDFASRHVAASAFPHDRGAARDLFKEHRDRVRQGGTLPWAIGDHFDALISAFVAGDREAILHRAGLLVHFCTDASLPFNTTVDRDGEPAGRMDRPGIHAGRPHPIHRTVRHRYQTTLIQAYRARFEHEVRVYPGRFRASMDPIESVFRALLDAHATLDELTRIDRILRMELDIVDAESFSATADSYYDGLARRAGGIIETRLEAGALLGANLIGAAWVRAGSPAIERLAPAVATQVASPGEPVGQGFVGSRNSGTFHRASCSHAGRIKPENRVRFPTAEAARAAGRKPCKTCQPDTPKP